MPVDFLSASNKVLSPVISGVAITPYADRLRALQETERIHEMMSNAAYAMQKEIPGEILSVVDRLWFGEPHHRRKKIGDLPQLPAVGSSPRGRRASANRAWDC